MQVVSAFSSLPQTLWEQAQMLTVVQNLQLSGINRLSMCQMRVRQKQIHLRMKKLNGRLDSGRRLVLNYGVAMRMTGIGELLLLLLATFLHLLSLPFWPAYHSNKTLAKLHRLQQC